MVIYCGSCGAENKMISSYCGKCGAELSSKAKSPDPTPKTYPYQPQQHQSTPAKQEQDYNQPQTGTQPEYQPDYQQGYQQGPQGYQDSSIDLFQPGYQQGYQPGHQPGMPSPHYPPPEIRSFGTWLLYGLLTLGIAIYVYQYKVIKDMNSLEVHSEHNYQGWVPYTTRLDEGEMLLWLIFLPPVFMYKKYNALNLHLKHVHGQMHDLPPQGNDIVVFLVLTIVFGIITLGIGFIVAFFVGLSYESRWQRALNNHIMLHGIEQPSPYY
ncbi:MAG: hypothetical protein ACXAD7_26515 [Candidatus Kariarchaeaceae archaeon]|jgi:hypothetical protein